MPKFLRKNMYICISLKINGFLERIHFVKNNKKKLNMKSKSLQRKDSRSGINSKILLLGVLTVILTLFSMNVLQAQQSYTFTNAGATGYQGPTQSQLDAEYANTNLDGQVTSNSGIQEWIVPSSGMYRIEVYGAQGGGANGGLGAKMEGEFTLNANDVLHIVVGQQGLTQSGEPNAVGGGGGSFVVKEPALSTSDILVIAGGGGGSPSTQYAIADASTTTSGNDGHVDAGVNNPDGVGGTGGDGGNKSVSGCSLDRGAGGGGFYTDGGSICQTAGNADGGSSFLNGVEGGTNNNVGTEGGFGGGGAVWTTGFRGSGGGGGYSGGGGGQINSNSANHSGGGGGSYNAGDNQINTAGVNSGHGLVVITIMSSGASNDAGAIAIDSPNVYCPGMHNVVATIMNFGTNQIDSVGVNWSINGVTQTPVSYTGTLDTMGGSGSATAQVTLGSINFTNAVYDISVWTSNPNGITDTVPDNDTVQALLQSSLPPPSTFSGIINATEAVIHWVGGSASNSWVYQLVPSGSSPTGVGTPTSVDSAVLTGLSPTTNYDFFVREVCPTGDTSSWSDPYFFRTPCIGPLNGVYTVDPNNSTLDTVFADFQDVVDALVECGISGPVEVQFTPGTYNQQVVIEEIPGASSTNTVTFNGLDPADVTITSSNAGPTIELDGATWLIFENMTINNTSTAVAMGIFMHSQTENIVIRNNVFNLNSTNFASACITASGNLANVTTLGDNASHIRIENNELYGGYYGISIQGVNTTNHNDGVEIIDNIIHGQYLYAIRLYAMHDLLVEGNDIDVSGSPTNSYGVYAYYTNNVVINKNIVKSRYAGLMVGYNNTNGATAAQSSTIISNNMVSMGYGYASPIGGMYLLYSARFEVIHNSVYSEGTGTVRALYLLANANTVDNRILNNIFVVSGGSTQYALHNNNDQGITALDYNVYYTTGTTFVMYDNQQVADLPQWQGLYSEYNENSLQEDPDFLFQTSSDLRIPTSKTHFTGDNGVSNIVSDDIFGTQRCFYIMGAYEIPLPVSPPVANFLAPDSIYINSPALFLNSPMIGEPQFDQWFVDGVFIADERNLEYEFSDTGTYEVMLVAEACDGRTDTLRQMIEVRLPDRAPSADFISNRQNVSRGEPVEFRDRSAYGPTSWSWSVDPPTVTVFGLPFNTFNFTSGTNSSSRNPVISFPWPGTFTITMIATNSEGSNTVIKELYINVGYNMCPDEAPDFTSSSDHAGLLFDHAGANSYSGSRSCNFRIEPCADTLFLVFDEFEMTCGSDYLRIYDGTDNTGTPMHCQTTSGMGFTGGDRVCGDECLPPDTLILLTGQAYIEYSTSSAGAEGFRMRWFTSGKEMGPRPSFFVEDEVCAGSEVFFENTSVGSGLHNFSWHFGEDPNAPFVNEYEPSYTYLNTGTHTVRLAAEDCEGLRDTFSFEVEVVNRNAPPVVSFSANNTAPMAGSEVVSFTSVVTDGCNDTYEWDISRS
jgi:PKD repeat protein